MNTKFILGILLKVLTSTILVLVVNGLEYKFFETNVNIFNVSIKDDINWNMIYFFIFMRVSSFLITNYFKSYFKITNNIL